MTEPIQLCFNQLNHLWVTEARDGTFALPEISAASRDWYTLDLPEIQGQERSVQVTFSDTEAPEFGKYKTIHDLCTASLSPELADVLESLRPVLHRIPYLGMGENEYIYRFRTAKERNSGIYVDPQSEGLYRSALCLAIKEARRIRENTSGEPAVLDFGAVRYVIPSHFGFCLGVQNAIERAYETVFTNPGRRVFMLSELIHNPFVNQDLLARGLRYLQTDKGRPLCADGSPATDQDDPQALWNQLQPEDLVIIPAFGATNEDKARLVSRGLAVRENDATCMLVEKVWKAARQYARKGYTVLIHGKSEHEETKATFSNSTGYGPALILRNMEHAHLLGKVILAEGDEKVRLFQHAFSGLCSDGFDPLCDLDRIAVVNQTTLLRNETLRIIDYLSKVFAEKYGEAKLSEHLRLKSKGDTLCYATQVNQDALHKAIRQSIDVALVVGGKNSSNTFQLYRVCREHFGDNAHYIQSERNILSLGKVTHYHFPYHLGNRLKEPEQVRPFISDPHSKPSILLTGGASCPDGIIQQLIYRINRFFDPREIRSNEEVLKAFQENPK